MQRFKEWFTSWREQRREKKAEKRELKRNRTVWQKIRQRTWLTIKVMFTLMIVCIIALCIIAKPIIDENRQTAFDKLATITNNTFSRMESTKVYDVNGELIQSINVSDFKYATIGDISDYLINGYIAVEDKRFLEHNGIDLKSLMRAGVALVKNKGEITQGGSTITQQLIKNTFLSQERTFKRKIIEIFMAPELEKKYSKNDILEFYMNSNFYGYNCYGVESASRYYFGKSAKEINAAEAATLIGISNNPSAYNPVSNPDMALKKRKQVLGVMLADGAITQKEYDDACKYELELILKRDKRDKENYMTSYAIYCTALKYMEQNGFEFKYTFKTREEYDAYNKAYNEAYGNAASTIRSGGYKIYTSLDPAIQSKLQETVDSVLSVNKRVDKDSGKYQFQGGAVVIDNSTGLVVAVVGGRGTDDEFNRGYQAVRQPGSSIKPILDYGPAFDTGRYYPSLKVDDKEIEDGPYNWYTGYKGKVSIRQAITESINTTAYNILMEITPEKGLEYLGKMRFSTLCDRDNVGAISLGGFTYGVTVSDMARAYYTVYNDGKFSDKSCITKIELQNVGVVMDTEPEKIQVYTEDTAYMLTSCMESAVNSGNGTAKVGRLSNFASACKTGTTNSKKDGWFCGFTPYYTCAVWVGYDTPKTASDLGGSSYPGRIWAQFMQKAHEGLEPVTEFEVPETIVEYFVDGNGNKTNSNTGVKDIFSSSAEIKLKKDEEEHQAAVQKAKEEATRADDTKQIQRAGELVTSYEKMKCETPEDVINIDKKYDECLVAIEAIASYDAKKNLTERLDIQKAVFDTVRKPLDDAVELKKKQEKEAEAERQKDSADVKALALGYTKDKLKVEINNLINTLSSVTNAKDEHFITLGKLQSYIEVFKGTNDYPELYSRYSAVETHLKNSRNAAVVQESPNGFREGSILDAIIGDSTNGQ